MRSSDISPVTVLARLAISPGENAISSLEGITEDLERTLARGGMMYFASRPTLFLGNRRW